MLSFRSFGLPLAALGGLVIGGATTYLLLTWNSDVSLSSQQTPGLTETTTVPEQLPIEHLKELYQLAKEDVLSALSDGTELCDNWRKTPGQRCTGAADCGKGWLFREKQLLLVIPGLDEPDVSKGGLAGDWQVGEARVLKVIGLREGGDGEQADCNAADLSILVRIQGPEALTQAALPAEDGSCIWSAEFRPMVDGVYTLDATVINWKAELEPHRLRCNEVPGVYPEGSVKIEGGVPVHGGPFYSNYEGCCTLCTRVKGCAAWTATRAPSVSLVEGDRCVLYSSVVGDAVENKTLNGVLRSGTSRNEEAMKFLSPAMSIGRSWCAERNTLLLGSGTQFNVKHDASSPIEEYGELPICRSNLLHEGRWVSLAGTSCNVDYTRVGDDGWPLHNSDGAAMPDECFLKPDMGHSKGSSLEKQELELVGEGYEWRPYSCRYELMNTEALLTCLRNANITKFMDYGDSLMITSRGPRTAMWMPLKPKIWSTGKARAQVTAGAEHAGCAGRGIMYYGEDSVNHYDVGHNPKGAFPTRYCGVEAFYQSGPEALSDFVKQFEPDVLLANWAMIHRMWHSETEEFKKFADGIGKESDAMTGSGRHRPRYMFWLSAPFLVSEREPHCVLERAVEFNDILRRVLEPRGWIEVDWMSMTRKWAFDIADGMHHGQPTVRMLAFMLMHHICHGAE